MITKKLLNKIADKSVKRKDINALELDKKSRNKVVNIIADSGKGGDSAFDEVYYHIKFNQQARLTPNVQSFLNNSVNILLALYSSKSGGENSILINTALAGWSLYHTGSNHSILSGAWDTNGAIGFGNTDLIDGTEIMIPKKIYAGNGGKFMDIDQIETTIVAPGDTTDIILKNIDGDRISMRIVNNSSSDFEFKVL